MGLGVEVLQDQVIQLVDQSVLKGHNGNYSTS